VNRLYFGDNLAWLRNTNEFPDANVDLVYIAVRIRGDSTAPRYVAGDITILAVSDPPKSDDLVIVKLRDEGIVFKKLQIVDPHEHLFRFISFNEQYRLWIERLRRLCGFIRSIQSFKN
jgi:phage repressor protein C with HTH and peptisase S24 domain